jgi:Uma2 family endonuclease
MGLAAERHTMTLDEFLAWESTQAERWEFLGGETFMMAGGSDVHNAISLNAAFSLRAAFHGKPCNVFMSDVRLHLAETGDLFYPDVFVTCSEADRARRQLKEDPLLIAEVLSPSTEAYDRGDKFAAYRRFPALATILFLSQDRPHVECYTRADAGRWTLTEASGADATLALPALGIELALAELYRDLPDAPATPQATAPAA